MSRFRQRLLAWIALFAVLFGTLAPTVQAATQMASAGEDGPYQLEICSAGGQHWITLSAEEARGFSDLVADLQRKAGGADGQSSGENGAQLAHCPLCCGHIGMAGLPSASLPPFALPAGPSLKPALFFIAARLLFAWSAVQPRAPPRAISPTA